MTLQTTVSKSGPIDGTGAATVYSYGFKIISNNQLVVTHLDSVTSIETIMVEGVDYDVTGKGNDKGGTIDDSIGSRSPIPSTESYTLNRIVPLTQLTDITTGGTFDPVVHEDTFDIITMGLQQLNEIFSRALLLPITDNSGAGLTLPTPESNTLIGWSNDTIPILQNFAIPGITALPLTQLDFSPASELDIIQIVGGIPIWTPISGAITNVDLDQLDTTGANNNDHIFFNSGSGEAEWGTQSTPTIDLTSDVINILPDANTANDLTIIAGAIDNTPIGAVTPSSGIFSALTINAGIAISTLGTIWFAQESDGGTISDSWFAESDTRVFKMGAINNDFSAKNPWVTVTRGAADSVIDVVTINGATVNIPNLVGGGGGGDVTGPGPAVTDEAIAVFDGVGGLTIKEVPVTIAVVTGNIDTAGTLTSGSGNIAVTNAVGNVLLPSLDPTSGVQDDVVFFDSGAWARGTITGIDVDLANDVGISIVADANVAEDLTLVGATINNSVIGAITPAAGTFSDLAVNAGIAISSPGTIFFSTETDGGTVSDSWFMEMGARVFKMGANDDDTTNKNSFLEVTRGAADSVINTVSIPNGDFEVSAGTAHIINGTSGATAHSNANDFVIEDDNNAGMSILSPDADLSVIYLGHNSSQRMSRIFSDFTSNEFIIASARAGAELMLKADNNDLNLTLSGATGNEDAEFEGRFRSSGTSTIASAASIAVKYNHHTISGTTQIDNITGGLSTQLLTLIMSSTVTFGNNNGGDGNMLLRDGADTEIVALRTITFVVTGTSPNTVLYQVS